MRNEKSVPVSTEHDRVEAIRRLNAQQARLQRLDADIDADRAAQAGKS